MGKLKKIKNKKRKHPVFRRKHPVFTRRHRDNDCNIDGDDDYFLPHYHDDEFWY